MFGCAGSSLLHRSSLVVVSKGYSLVIVCRFLVAAEASLGAGHRPSVQGLQYLWFMGLVAAWLVESSPARVQTCVPCIGRWILIHCTTREAPPPNFFS